MATRPLATRMDSATATARHGETPSIDPVSVEVIRGAMETVAYEMATHVSLTATTPILNQSNERNATILDGRPPTLVVPIGNGSARMALLNCDILMVRLG